MELSKKVQQMHLSPIRKFNGYAIDARAEGVKVYNLNIGQPDIKTPKEFMQAINSFDPGSFGVLGIGWFKGTSG